MKHQKGNSPKVAETKNNVTAIDTKSAMAELRAKQKALREQMKLQREQERAAKASTKVDITKKWLAIFETRLRNLEVRRVKIESTIAMLKDRLDKQTATTGGKKAVAKAA